MSKFRRRLIVGVQKSDVESMSEIVTVTTSGSVTVPEWCSRAQLFLVGGGGSGAAHSNKNGRCGSGGNGGEVHLATVDITPSASITINIGNGGSAVGYDKQGNAGGDTQCIIGDTTYTARGGSGGVNAGKFYDSLPSGKNWKDYQAELQSIGNRGGYGCINGTHGEAGQDGVLCPFLKTEDKYGASGAGGSDCHNLTPSIVSGGNTGGGYGGYGTSNANTNTGGDATFYGGGGGGGGFNSNHKTGGGGSGYQGIAILRFYN